MRFPRSRTIALAVLAAAGAGCAGVGDAGVAIRPLSVDVVFGVPPEEQVAAPPNVPMMPAQPPNRVFEPTHATVPPARAVELCPAAKVTDSARFEAPLILTDERPRPGSYRWKRAGTITTGETTTTLEGFEQRFLVDWEEREPVAPFSGDPAAPRPSNLDPAFGYSTLQPAIDDPSVITKIDWNYDNSLSQRVNPPAAVQGASEDARPFRTGNDGLGIERITRYRVADDGSLEPLGLPFQPDRPVTYLSHPITLQETYRSVGVDPATHASMVMIHKPVAKTQIDACGDKVDAYVVEADMTFTDGASVVTSTLRYGVATQYGAYIVFEDAETTAGDTVAKTHFSLGQIDPGQDAPPEIPE